MRSPANSERSSFSSATLSAAIALFTANITVRSASAPSGKRSRSTSCVTSTVTVSVAAVGPVRLSVKPAVPSKSQTRVLSAAIVTTGTPASTIVTVASDGVPAVTPAGSVPKVSATLSPGSASVSSVAASVKVCSVSVAPKVTLSGTPDQSAPVSPGGVAPPAPAAETGTTTSRPGAASSCTVTSTVPPSSTEYDSAPNDTAAERGVTVASSEGSLTSVEKDVRTWKVCDCPPTRPVTV